MMYQHYKRHISFWLATWFGSGLSRKAPGTMGSLAALPFAWAIQYFAGSATLAFAALAAFAAGCWATGEYLKHTEKQDPGEIVIDEVAAMWLLLAAAPLTWQWYVICFFAFRAFDVVKPWPVSLADSKIKGAFGVMFDDMLAALYPILLWIAFTRIAVASGNEGIIAYIYALTGLGNA